jgi:chemotaxis protein MotB
MLNGAGMQKTGSTSGNANLTSYRSLIDKADLGVDNDSNWMITMSDVMSLLLIFFIMFFVMTRNTVKSEEIKTEKVVKTDALGTGILPDSDAVGKRISDELNIGFMNLNMGEHISVSVTNRAVMITMKEQVSFSPGEVDILEATDPVLETIAGIIHRYPDYHVEIDGHTDNIPIRTSLYPSNWELSVARATSVLKYFINKHNIDPSRLSVRGNADQKPVAPNNTPENRARNRRVEIKLKKIDA